uniref:Uncharacterized protein n=1 Tax=Megaselia scalaris TaxID=36166 RepID=T1GB34_MEGSC
MEKKAQQIYSRQGSNKTLQQSDPARKNNETQSTKPKNPRRRENKNLPSKFEATRQQTNKSRLCLLDKRPKPRGFQQQNHNYEEGASNFNNLPSTSLSSNDIAADYEGSIDCEIEVNSIYNAGSKKQNLNHLLNFNYVSREDSHNIFGRYDGRNSAGTENRTSEKRSITRSSICKQ